MCLGNATMLVSLNPHIRLIPSEIGSFNHQVNQLHVACDVTNIITEIDGGHNQSSHDLVVDHSTYGQRTAYGANPSYRSMGSEANLVEFGLPAVETVVPRRISRQLSIIEHVNEGNGRVRTGYDRDEDIGHGRWVSETLAMIDWSTFYDSRNLFDEHDMRLDIDNMSYEELLTLEEQIGNVNMGLSEGAISKCLMETIYCSD